MNKKIIVLESFFTVFIMLMLLPSSQAFIKTDATKVYIEGEVNGNGKHAKIYVYQLDHDPFISTTADENGNYEISFYVNLGILRAKYSVYAENNNYRTISKPVGFNKYQNTAIVNFIFQKIKQLIHQCFYRTFYIVFLS